MKHIALEEHFLTPELARYIEETYQNVNKDLAAMAVPRLMDVGQERLNVMDACGLDFAVLSIAGPGVQIEPDINLAIRLAKQANDDLAAIISKNPDRYGGLAHLAMQDPGEAADELERCVTDLGFQGAMVNGQTLGVYLDAPENEIFWERAAALKAPVYIHPGNPTSKPVCFDGHPGLWGPFWSWGVETATHALRLILAGVFERHPDARLILGHMGETLPFMMWRFDSRLPISYHPEPPLPHTPSYYLKKNVTCTTSGVFDDTPLQCALHGFGEDNVMYSIDYPFEAATEAGKWIKEADIPASVKEKICSKNAESILLNMK